MVGGGNPGYMWWGKSRVYVVHGGSPGYVKVGEVEDM